MSAATGHDAGRAEPADDPTATTTTPGDLRADDPVAAARSAGAHTASPTPPRPPGFAATVAAVLRKELLLELRTLESVPGMALFAVTVFVVFHFALNRNGVNGDEAAGILWVTLLLAALLGINRLFVLDAADGGFDGYLLAPVSRSAMLLAKALTLLIYLVLLELVAVPAFALLLLEPSLGPALPDLPLILLLGDVGVALIGTLVAALAVQTRARDLLGPLLALPLLVPVVIGGARASAPLLVLSHPTGPQPRWPVALGLYDLLFGLVAYAVFDFLLED
ncbi:MAG TPA: heme exporter protein CcmB [Solirubrobacteraceae bacterium]|nr:heme exporter protein CcmB [Solirubrobacteraceae bacterium]